MTRERTLCFPSNPRVLLRAKTCAAGPDERPSGRVWQVETGPQAKHPHPAPALKNILRNISCIFFYNYLIDSNSSYIIIGSVRNLV